MTIRSVHVVVPARDEQDLLPACLASLAGAREHLAVVRPDIGVRISVVLDGCTDGSSAVAERAGVDRIPVGYGNVGRSRHEGMCTALLDAAECGVRAAEVWLACTDADTVVPANWLLGHVEAAARYDALVGTVEPLGLTETTVLAQWRRRHRLGEGHPHVHGANLGVRGSLYLQVGGFRPLATNEDVDLVRRIREATDRWVATDTVRVRSSARRVSRCSGGFATYLLALDEEVG